MSLKNKLTREELIGLTTEELEKLSPMMKQYVDVKYSYQNDILFYRLGDFYEMFFNDAKLASGLLQIALTGRDCGISSVDVKYSYQNDILFYRLGDFYEMFFNDAKLASGLLQIALTGRDCGISSKAPMCGVPFAHAESYIDRLLQLGYNVAICEQTEDSSQKKGMLERRVVRVHTPATVVSSSILSQDENNYICCAYKGERNFYGLCFADVSTGEISAMEFAEDDGVRLCAELVRMQPRCVLVNQALESDAALLDSIAKKYGFKLEPLEDTYFNEDITVSLIESHYQQSIEAQSMADKPFLLRSVGALMLYVYELDEASLKTLQPVRIANYTDAMDIDATAIRDLELVSAKTKAVKGTALIDVINRTKTGMGSRMLRQLLTRPLGTVEEIDKRLDAVEELVNRPSELSELRVYLAKILDFDRVLSKITYGTCTPRDVVAIARGLRQVVEIKRIVESFTAYNLRLAGEAILDLTSLSDYIESSIVQSPPTSFKEGGVIAEGFDEELDKLRELSQNFKNLLTQHEAAIKERTGIKGIKIQYNRISGYFYEIPTSNKVAIPEDFVRRQALANSERYISPELKELEEKIFTSGELLYEPAHPEMW